MSTWQIIGLIVIGVLLFRKAAWASGKRKAERKARERGWIE